MDLAPLKIERERTPARSGGRARRSTNWFGWGLLVVLIAGAWFFRAPLLALADRFRLPEVQIARATRMTALTAGAVAGTAANGYIVASKRAALSADTPGRIVELNVKEGSVVRKGDVVARLYSDEYQASLDHAVADVAAQRASIERAGKDLAVAQAETRRARADTEAAAATVADAQARLKQTAAKRDRAERMFTDDIESQQWLDDARTDHERAVAAEQSVRASLSAAEAAAGAADQRVVASQALIDEASARIPVLQAMVEQAQATLDKTAVRAPFDGVVVLKDAEVGEVVSPNAQGGQSRGSVATMVDFSTLEVQVELPERNITNVTVGAAVKIFVDAFPDRPYSGKVQRIWPVANRQKATIEVRASFDQLDDQLRPEMGVRVVFISAEAAAAPTSAAAPPSGVLVPSAAIVRIEGRRGVFALERDAVRFTPVEVGEERSGDTLVRQGLEGEERVVVDPPASLADGDRVRVKGGPRANHE